MRRSAFLLKQSILILIFLLLTSCYLYNPFQGSTPIAPIAPVEFMKCYGGTGYDKPYSIVQTNDGGYIALGNTNSNDGDVSGTIGDFDFWVL